MPWRILLLFGIVFILFSLLVWRLAYMQLANRDFYVSKLARASKTKVTTSTIRGEIYDAQNQPLVTNTTRKVLSFTRDNHMTHEELLATAKKIRAVVTISDTNRVTAAQKADFYLADPKVYQEIVKSLPKSKRFDDDGNFLPEKEIYQAAVAAIDPKKLAYDQEDLKIIRIYSQMAAVANFQTGTIETDPLTEQQLKTIESDLTNYPGVSISTAWDREVLDTPLASIIGRVSSQENGLPEDEVEDYLKKGYALNDRVGTSYLEKAYEDDLQGQRAVKEIHLDRDGNLDYVENLHEGKKGNNLKLTLDLTFQKGVEDILISHLQSEINQGNAAETPGVYAVVLNPNDGSVLAMAGVQQDLETGQLRSNALGTITDVFVPGSVVKGATLTTAWQEDVIRGNQVLVDHPISFGGGAPINSWFTQYGNREITAQQALEFSSNTYMVQLALRMLNPNGDSSNATNASELDVAMSKLRKGFGQYGLGTTTGIDLPNESHGFIPAEFTFANYLTNSFGQFDTYTPMQLAQYAATVANGGNRISPHLVEGIYESDDQGKLGKKLRSISGKVLNHVDLSDEDRAILQRGFYQVVHGQDQFTTGRAIGEGAALSISAKTGTAEVMTASGRAAVNTNVVAYAPSDQPQIAISVVFPHNRDALSTVSQRITRDIVNLYYRLYGQGPQVSQPQAAQKEAINEEPAANNDTDVSLDTNNSELPTPPMTPAESEGE